MKPAAAALFAVLASAGLPATAPAAVTIGLSDQKPSMFDDPRFAALGVGNARLVVPWDATSSEPARLDAWLSAARRAGSEVLIAFEHRRADRCPDSPCVAPTPSEFGAAFDDFHQRYPWVQLITPWNEANHPWQPTFDNPQRAAEYYDEVRSRCPECRVVAADVLDSPNMASWLTSFMRYVHGDPQLWGLHDYADANDFTDAGLRAMLGLTHGEVWLTETGGLVRLVRDDGFLRYPYNEDRAARAVTYVAGLAESAAPRVPRVYFYNWQADAYQPDFDAGLIGPDGASRPGLRALAALLGRTAEVETAEGPSAPAPGSLAAVSGAPGATPAAASPYRPGTATRTRALIVRRKARSMTVRIECARRTDCRGAVAVRTRRRTLGRALFAVAQGELITVSVPLAKQQRRWLARHRRAHLRADLLLQ